MLTHEGWVCGGGELEWRGLGRECARAVDTKGWGGRGRLLTPRRGTPGRGRGGEMKERQVVLIDAHPANYELLFPFFQAFNFSGNGTPLFRAQMLGDD